VFPRHEKFSSLLVTRASFEARVGEGRGLNPMAYAFFLFDVILHGAGFSWHCSARTGATTTRVWALRRRMALVFSLMALVFSLLA